MVAPLAAIGFPHRRQAAGAAAAPATAPPQPGRWAPAGAWVAWQGMRALLQTATAAQLPRRARPPALAAPGAQHPRAQAVPAPTGAGGAPPLAGRPAVHPRLPGAAPALSPPGLPAPRQLDLGCVAARWRGRAWHWKLAQRQHNAVSAVEPVQPYCACKFSAPVRSSLQKCWQGLFDVTGGGTSHP